MRAIVTSIDELAARPKGSLTTAFAWLGWGALFVSVAGVIATYVLPVSQIAYQFGLEWDLDRVASAFEALFYAGATALTIWIISAGVDRLDALVWLNASRADRIAIYRKRRRRDPPAEWLAPSPTKGVQS